MWDLGFEMWDSRFAESGARDGKALQLDAGQTGYMDGLMDGWMALTTQRPGIVASRATTTMISTKLHDWL